MASTGMAACFGWKPQLVGHRSDCDRKVRALERCNFVLESSPNFSYTGCARRAQGVDCRNLCRMEYGTLRSWERTRTGDVACRCFPRLKCRLGISPWDCSGHYWSVLIRVRRAAQLENSGSGPHGRMGLLSLLVWTSDSSWLQSQPCTGNQSDATGLGCHGVARTLDHLDVVENWVA